MTVEIPEAMVVASARRRYEETWRHDDSAAGVAFGVEDLGPWEDVEPEEQSWWLDEARADLVAAFEVRLDLLQSVLEALDEWRTMIGDYGLRPASDRVRDLVAAYDDYLRLRSAEGK